MIVVGELCEKLTKMVPIILTNLASKVSQNGQLFSLKLSAGKS